MAVQPGIADQMPKAASGRDAGRVLRVLALIAVAIGLAALTAAACVLSYSSIHHLAIQAGVSPRLARLYPLIFDALLVVAGCCVLALRGAGLISRLYSWLCLLVLLGALAGGGAVRAAAIKVPHRLAGILAAVIPWALVLIGFGLLHTLLRYARIRRLAQLAGEPGLGHAADPAAPGELVVIESTTATPRRAAGPAALVPGLTRAPAPVEPAPVEPAPVDAAPGHAAAGQAAELAHAAIRQADLQLRARVPRQSAGQAHASPVTARHAPFMPPVGPLPASEAPAAGAAAADPGDSGTGEEAGADPATRAGASPSTQETNPRPLTGQPAGAGATAVNVTPQDVTLEKVTQAMVTQENEAAAGTAPPDQTPPGQTPPGQTPPDPTAAAPVTATGLNPAPVIDDEDAEPGAPPALRRPRSSPTPPED
jgi:hypothetical protein